MLRQQNDSTHMNDSTARLRFPFHLSIRNVPVLIASSSSSKASIHLTTLQTDRDKGEFRYFARRLYGDDE